MSTFVKSFQTRAELDAELFGISEIGKYVKTPRIIEVNELSISYEYIEEGITDFKIAAAELAKLHQVSIELFA